MGSLFTSILVRLTIKCQNYHWLLNQRHQIDIVEQMLRHKYLSRDLHDEEKNELISDENFVNLHAHHGERELNPLELHVLH